MAWLKLILHIGAGAGGAGGAVRPPTFWAGGARVSFRPRKNIEKLSLKSSPFGRREFNFLLITSRIDFPRRVVAPVLTKNRLPRYNDALLLAKAALT